MSNLLQPFHLAFPVDDLAAARRFYGELLGCSEGRSDERWVDFNLYGHQITAHLIGAAGAAGPTSPVDGEDVPVPHFGVILSMEEWRALAERLEAGGADFIIEPTVRFKGRPGEQATLFVRDPSGNALEFKAFAEPACIFATG